MKPIIGIITRPELSTGKNPIMCLYKKISNAIIINGGIPLGIDPTETQFYFGKNLINTHKMSEESFLDMKRIIDMCDGIILQGGDEFYDYDLKVVEYCYKEDIPTLGICLGMQTMGYFFNGNLGRLANNNHDSKNKYMHSVILDETSKLYKILNKKNLDVNSRHKDYLIKTDLKVVGISNDNIIEAIEDKNKRFFIGVQWHPETMIEYDKIMKRLFEYFINTCSKGEKNDSKKIARNYRR